MANQNKISTELESRIQQYVEFSKCACSSVEDHLSVLQKQLPPATELQRITNFFKALSNINRIKITYLLYQTPKCNCELEGLLDVGQSTISHHVKVLSEAELIKIEKQGKWSIYILNEDFKEWFGALLKEDLLPNDH